MRKIFRIGVIAVATGAVVIYLATTYALHHPESVLAQCTMTGLQLTAGFHPLYHAGAAVSRTAYRIVGGQSTTVQLTPEEEEQLLCVPPDPMPVEEAAPLEPPPAFSEAQRDFILQTIKEELQRHRQTPEDDAAPVGLTEVRLKPVSEVEPPIAKEEDDFPNTMPHCLDGAETPDLMPPAAETTSIKSTDPLFEFWLGLFESAAEESKEASSYYHDEEPPQCLEDPTYQYQYPGCPYTGKCPQEEGAGTPKISDPVPAVKPARASAPKASQPAGKGKASKGMTDPKKYELPARLRQNLPGDSTEAQEEPAHPDVDTTEFRPADAKPGEFDPKPM